MINKSIVPFIKEQFPKYILESSSLFPDFLEAYYEWMNLQGNTQEVLYSLEDSNNVDLSYDKFQEEFISEYIDDIPSYSVANKQLLIKKINELYKAKGTPKAVQFLLRILYDIDSDVFFPSTQIFKASSAKWNRDVSVRFTVATGSVTLLEQQYGSIDIDGKLIDIIILKIEKDVQGVTGLYEAFIDVKYKLLISNGGVISTSTFTGNLVPTIVTKSILHSGKHYVVGDIFDITNLSGTGLKIKVTKVDETSGLKGFQIIQFGVNFDDSFTKRIQPVSNTLLSEVDVDPDVYQANIQFTLGYVIEYPGYYSTNVGFPSDASYIHDGEYYQQFSYEIQSEKSFSDYETPLLKLIHPAGLKAYAKYTINATLDITVNIETILNKINTKLQSSFGLTDNNYYFITSKSLGDNDDVLTFTDTQQINSSKTIGDNDDVLSFTDSIIFGYLYELALQDANDFVLYADVNPIFDTTRVVSDANDFVAFSDATMAFDSSRTIGDANDFVLYSDSAPAFNSSNTIGDANDTITMTDVINSIILSQLTYTTSIPTTPSSVNLTALGASDYHKVDSSSALNVGYRKGVVTGGTTVAITPVPTSNVTYTNAGSTATANNVPIGTASSTRMVVICIGSGNAQTLTSATIGGISATIRGQSIASDAFSAVITAVVPTGTTATVVLNFGATLFTTQYSTTYTVVSTAVSSVVFSSAVQNTASNSITVSQARQNADSSIMTVGFGNGSGKSPYTRPSGFTIGYEDNRILSSYINNVTSPPASVTYTWTGNFIAAATLITFRASGVTAGANTITVTEEDPSNIVTQDYENKLITFSGSDSFPTMTNQTASARFVTNGTSLQKFGYSVRFPASNTTKTAKIWTIAYNNLSTSPMIITAFLIDGATETIISQMTSQLVTTTQNVNTYYLIDLSFKATNTNANTRLVVYVEHDNATVSRLRALFYLASWVSA